MGYIIRTEYLTKEFKPAKKLPKFIIGPQQARKSVLALKDVNLKIKEGEVFALVGPNGAGKTTLIKILCSLILPTKGRVYIDGYEVSKYNKKIKILVGLITGDRRSFYWRLTGRENLNFYAALYNLTSHQASSEITRLARILKIEKDLDNQFGEYSTGTKQKLAILRGLLNNPKILLIDELTINLDPIITQEIRTFLKEKVVSEQGKTVIFATHNLGEVENFAHRIAIIDRGQIKMCGTLVELKQMMSSPNASALEVFTYFIRNKNSMLEEQNESDRISSAESNGCFSNNGYSLSNFSYYIDKLLKYLGYIKSNLKKIFAFIKKDFLLLTSYRLFFLSSPIGGNLHLIIFYIIISIFLKQGYFSLAQSRLDYLPFLFIGIVFSIYQYSGQILIPNEIRQEQLMGTLESILVTPNNPLLLVLSKICYFFVLDTIAILTLLLLGVWFLNINLSNLNFTASFIITILYAISSYSIGIIMAGMVILFKKIEGLNRILSGFVKFFGGVFFSVTLFPIGLRLLSHCLPITYSLRALRKALLEGYAIKNLSFDLIVLLFFSLILFPLGIVFFKYALKRIERYEGLQYY